MCCRTIVQPLHVPTAVYILGNGLFKPVYWLPNRQEYAVRWERVIAEEGTTVSCSISGDVLELRIAPAISVYIQHLGKRISASVYFEIAAKYAEKVGGEITQHATVTGCTIPGHRQQLPLGRYPSLPLSFDRVCAGFRAVFLSGEEDDGNWRLPGANTLS